MTTNSDAILSRLKSNLYSKLLTGQKERMMKLYISIFINIFY